MIFACGVILTVAGIVGIRSSVVSGARFQFSSALCAAAGVALLVTTRRHLAIFRSWCGAFLILGVGLILSGMFVLVTGFTPGILAHATEPSSAFIPLTVGFSFTFAASIAWRLHDYFTHRNR
jgi:hypothetical protein